MTEVIRRNPRMAWRHHGEMMVIINPDDRNLHEFNETATFIWNSLEGEGLEKEALLDRMAMEFDAPRDALRDDLNTFIRQTVNIGILLSETPFPQPRSNA